MSDQDAAAPDPADMTPVILEALKAAAAAHGVHEAVELKGVYDEQWPEWYAAHMTKTFADAGYRLVRSA
ncbi:hypothetical protein ACFVWR_12715 [Leifsonia sp. NPDC058292]|uniref:hypothetical protein n=1 Tax=Leifsonia sp. NPDC058292 TaxID=3346428 RepID=UPI0036DAF204